MVEGVENLFLEHLQRFQPSLDRMEYMLDEMIVRASQCDDAFAAAKLQLVDCSTANIAKLATLENISQCLDRIERRLELTN